MKVYGGFKFLTNDIHEIDDFVNKLRQEYSEFAKDKAKEFFGDTIAHYVDHMTLHPEEAEEGASPWQVAFKHFSDIQRKIKREGIRDSSVDYSFEILVIPFENEFYGIVYTQQPELTKDFLSHTDIVRDFHYQNQADEPEDVSDEEWKERKRVWEAIFDNNSIPALNGFLYQIVLEEFYDYPMPENLLNSIPEFESRVDNQARNKVYSKFMKNRKPNEENIGKILQRYSEHFRSDDGQKEYNEYKEQISNQLKKTISIEDMKKLKVDRIVLK